MLKKIVAAVFLLCFSFAVRAADNPGKLELTKVDEQKGGKGNTLYVFTHKAADGLDSPGYIKAGYEYHLTVSLPAMYKPDSERNYPVMLWLHGFGDKWDDLLKVGTWFPNYITIIPNDPLGTWFYGYSDQLPGGDPNSGTVVNYTERRLLKYLEYVLKKYKGDKNRVFVLGGSMGGTGATSLALRYPELFAGADARKGATNRKYCKWKNQCETIWGNSSAGVLNNEGFKVWEWQNMAWYAQKFHKNSTWLRTLNGKEDVSIPFRQLAGPAGVKPMSFYKAMEEFKIGHQCFWDGTSHSKRPEVNFVQEDFWDPFTDGECYLRLDLSFPAFSNFTANNNPGTGMGDAVGPDGQLGDNTYDGDPAGGFNRFLRWNSETIVDTQENYAIDIKLTPGGDGYKGNWAETVDATMPKY
ncbi:MAG: alpha/beta hydrolase-fold protein [Candidatus Firestonebacteria bacterium]